MEIIAPPRVEQRAERTYLGIREITPFRGMLGRADELGAELRSWGAANEIERTGPAFLRLHTIDMQGEMDLEVGIVCESAGMGDSRVRPGLLPAGRYATLTYQNHAMRANRALLEWIEAEGVVMDKEVTAEGDRFGCRYEAYLTDPRLEPRKTKWHVELSIRLRD